MTELLQQIAASSKFRRLAPLLGVLAILLVVGGLFTYTHFFRTEPPPFFASEEDHFLVPRIGRAIARKYHSKSATYPGHGHSIMTEPGWEMPAAQIAAWLDEVLSLDASAA